MKKKKLESIIGHLRTINCENNRQNNDCEKSPEISKKLKTDDRTLKGGNRSDSASSLLFALTLHCLQMVVDDDHYCVVAVSESSPQTPEL
jgi:hypothetical protein